MADASDFEIDPAIAAAMGFSGFGVANNKKRKFNRDDGFIDPDVKAKGVQSSGANSVAMGPRSAPKTPHDKDPADLQSTRVSKPKQDTRIVTQDDSGEPSLEAYRHGVKNASGDMVYFKASFVEDPWAPLYLKTAG